MIGIHQNLKIMRKTSSTIFSPSYLRLKLHGFNDASQLHVYPFDSRSMSVDSAPLVAESKVVTMNIKTILRLELCAAVLLSNLLGEVLENFNYDAPIKLGTDSKTMLNWISGSFHVSPKYKNWRIKRPGTTTISRQPSRPYFTRNGSR